VLRRHAEFLAERTTVAPAPFVRVENGFVVRHGTRDEPIKAPEGAKNAVFCELDGRYYVNTDHDLYAVDAAGAAEKIEPSGEPFSWLGGVAYDSRRRRIVITTFWHAGVHHVYDLVAHTWQTVDITRSHGGIHAIAYDETRDAMFAVGLAPFGCRVIVLPPDLDDVRLVAAAEKLPFPEGLEMQADIRAQIALFRDALLVSWKRDDWAHSVVSPDPPEDEETYLVRLDRDELLRVNLDAAVRHDPVTRDFTSGIVRDRYEGWITLADLRRDPRTIAEQVARTEAPLLVNHPRGLHTMLVSYYLYQGQLASLDEVLFPDWRERLARAEHEIAAERFAPSGPAIGEPGFVWTEQAAGDYAALGDDDRRLLSALLHRSPPPGSCPMDGPFAGWFASAIHTVRVIFRRRDAIVIVGYLRSGARHNVGRLVPPGVAPSGPS
jgi:hypothetical protein